MPISGSRLLVALGAVAAVAVVAPARVALADPPITVSGTERIAWLQAVPFRATASALQFVPYVDGTKGDALVDVTCGAETALRRVDCTAALPPMSAGVHRLQIVAELPVRSTIKASPKSLALTLLVAPPAVGTTQARVAGLAVTPATAMAPAPLVTAVTAADGRTWQAGVVAAGLDQPSSVAAAPDGRVYVAERTGVVRLWAPDGAASPDVAGPSQALPVALRLGDAASLDDRGLIGLAVDPRADTGYLYVAYTARVGDDGPGDVGFVNRVVRYRDVGGVLGQAAILLEDKVDAPPTASPRIRVAPDGTLTVLFPRTTPPPAGGRASYAGAVLRLNDDGTTPADNVGLTPIVDVSTPGSLVAPIAPVMIAWQTPDRLWVVAADTAHADAGETLRLVPTAFTFFAFDGGADVSGAAFDTTSDLFVSEMGGASLVRLHVGAQNPGRVTTAADRLLVGVYGRLSDVTSAPDGLIYVTTANGGGTDRLVRLRPVAR